MGLTRYFMKDRLYSLTNQITLSATNRIYFVSDSHESCKWIPIATCELLTRESLGTSVTINSTEYRNPPVTGDNVTFLCLSGELMGPKRTTCQKNGDWEPDPSGTMCKQAPPSCKLMLLFWQAIVRLCVIDLNFSLICTFDDFHSNMWSSTTTNKWLHSYQYEQ